MLHVASKDALIEIAAPLCLLLLHGMACIKKQLDSDSRSCSSRLPQGADVRQVLMYTVRQLAQLQLH